LEGGKPRAIFLLDTWNPSQAKENHAMPHLLIFDEEEGIGVGLCRLLEGQLPGLRVERAESGERALALLRQGQFDVALLDCSTLDASETVRQTKEAGLDTCIVLMSRCTTPEMAARAIKEGAGDFWRKPLDLAALPDRIAALITAQHPVVHPLARKLDAYLRAHCMEASLRLGDLCRHHCISTSYAASLFHRYLHTSFRRRLRQYRLEQARILLRETNKPIHQVARECGYKDYRRLTEAFHQEEGICPRLYRRNSPLPATQKS
jgi:YesN/AraC family two-component response regulator